MEQTEDYKRGYMDASIECFINYVKTSVGASPELTARRGQSITGLTDEQVQEAYKIIGRRDKAKKAVKDYIDSVIEDNDLLDVERYREIAEAALRRKISYPRSPAFVDCFVESFAAGYLNDLMISFFNACGREVTFGDLPKGRQEELCSIFETPAENAHRIPKEAYEGYWRLRDELGEAYRWDW